MITFLKQSSSLRSFLPVLNIHPLLLFMVPLFLLWFWAPLWLFKLDNTIALPDAGIWILILLSFMVFLMVIGLCWYLLESSWQKLGLPGINVLVLHFKHIELWQQLTFYWLSFALLLIIATGCLMAIC